MWLRCEAAPNCCTNLVRPEIGLGSAHVEIEYYKVESRLRLYAMLKDVLSTTARLGYGLGCGGCT